MSSSRCCSAATSSPAIRRAGHEARGSGRRAASAPRRARGRSAGRRCRRREMPRCCWKARTARSVASSNSAVAGSTGSSRRRRAGPRWPSSSPSTRQLRPDLGDGGPGVAAAVRRRAGPASRSRGRTGRAASRDRPARGEDVRRAVTTLPAYSRASSRRTCAARGPAGPSADGRERARQMKSSRSRSSIGLRLGADDRLHDLAALVDVHRRDRHDAVGRRGARVLVDVELDDRRSCRRARRRSPRGSGRPAGTVRTTRPRSRRARACRCCRTSLANVASVTVLVLAAHGGLLSVRCCRAVGAERVGALAGDGCAPVHDARRRRPERPAPGPASAASSRAAR